ncbi:RING zinc finger-containing protein [Tieghemostelium lacteum]|uniref:RING-type E3 ubiquitin transferase (cysteine targeting) n=1 Tax=Tieghemostelium lacteum TaxID=361077 RepID=A0A152A4A7_TIELA|nr:RING zinc finger-containing protein [Tieghemostelium lacteum]|eukprot:KYR01049.1 RING zinc finger-containing protein [Tieghemostelium lacteum]
MNITTSNTINNNDNIQQSPNTLTTTPVSISTTPPIHSSNNKFYLDSDNNNSSTLDSSNILLNSVKKKDKSTSIENTDWGKEYDNEKKKLEELSNLIQISKRPSTNVVKVSQLDSSKLDDEILDLLRTQFMKVFMFFKPNFISNFQPEINLILKSLIFKLSIFNLGTTYGNQLQNLTYRNEAAFDPRGGSDKLIKLTQRQKWMSGIFNIGGEWLWTRIQRISINDAWSERPPDDIRKRLWNLLNLMESAYKILSILNFLTFLYDGKYVTLVNRLLRMRLVYAHPSLSRRISFEYMNRQLVWYGFTEFFLFIMPLINVDKIKGFLYRMFLKSTFGKSGSANGGAHSNNPNALPVQNKHQLAEIQHQLALQKCPICIMEPINIPYSTDCGHLFCYYCIKVNTLIDSSFACPRCNSLVSRIKRYTGVDE